MAVEKRLADVLRFDRSGAAAQGYDPHPIALRSQHARGETSLVLANEGERSPIVSIPQGYLHLFDESEIVRWVCACRCRQGGSCFAG